MAALPGGYSKLQAVRGNECATLRPTIVITDSGKNIGPTELHIIAS